MIFVDAEDLWILKLHFNTVLVPTRLPAAQFHYFIQLLFYFITLAKQAWSKWLSWGARGVLTSSYILGWAKGVCCSPRWSPTKPQWGLEAICPPSPHSTASSLVFMSVWSGWAGRCQEKRMLKKENPLWKVAVIRGALWAPRGLHCRRDKIIS